MKKKVATPVTPATVEVPPAKVAAKKGAVKLAVPAAPVVKKAATPFRKSYPVAKTSTANLCGGLAAMQQARSVLHSARGIGDALDTLTRLENQARQQLGEAVNGELKTRRVKTTGMNISTESKPDGVHIVLTKQVAQ